MISTAEACIGEQR